MKGVTEMGKLKALYMSNYITASVKEEEFTEQPEAKKSIPFLIWLSFFVIYSVMGLFIKTVSFSGEFLPAACASVLTGRDWFSVMPAPDSLGQLLQGIFYLPSMLIFREPIAQYASYMVISAMIYALIPLMAYRMTLRFSVTKTRQRVLTASVCGLLPAILGGSRFLVTEPFTAVIGWALLMLLTDDLKSDKKKKMHLLSSVGAGALCGFAFLINNTYFSLFAAILIYLIFLQASGRSKPVSITVFFITFMLIAVSDHLFTMFFAGSSHIVSGSDILDRVTAAFHGLCTTPVELFIHIGGRAYYLTVASFGLATAAIALIIIIYLNYIRKKKRRTEQFYSENIYLFGILIFIITVTAILTDSFLSLGRPIISQEQMFSAIPVYPVISALVFLFFIYLQRYGATYVRVMAMISLIGLVSVAAIIICSDTADKINAFITAQSQGISALKPGFETTSALTGDTMIYPVLFIFTAFAAIIPIVCCAKEYAHKITVLVAAGLILYSSVFTIIDTCATYNAKAESTITSVTETSGFIKHGDKGEMPCVAVYSADTQLAMNMQYFNQDSEVVRISSPELVPDSCYLVTDTDVKPDGYAVLVGRAGDLSVYACGEEAVLYHEQTTKNELTD